MDALTEKIAEQTKGSWVRGSGGFDGGDSTPSCLRGMTVLLEELDGIRLELKRLNNTMMLDND